MSREPTLPSTAVLADLLRSCLPCDTEWPAGGTAMSPPAIAHAAAASRRHDGAKASLRNVQLASLSDRDRRFVHSSAQKEQFSLAYLHAVASVAGFNLGHFHVDDDSVDVVLKAPGEIAGIRQLHLNIQLKCTQNLAGDDEHWSFRLKRKNYEDLRRENVHVPAILVVLHVPRDVASWLVAREDAMTLSRRAYWVSLSGSAPLPSDQQSVVVRLPRRNVFDVAGLHSIVAGLASGAL